MQEEVLTADVLCVGGGIAGLMAAIRAADLGARVIVADKGNTLRSGAGGMGNDHFRCYIPEVHGPDIRPLLGEMMNASGGATKSPAMLRVWMERSYDVVKLWDNWGIPMKSRGEWYFAGQTLPGRIFAALKYSGLQQKPILTAEARKRGVDIINRVMMVDLVVGDNGVAGAVGIDTREDRLLVFQANSIVMATGWCVRLYPSPTPGFLFNRSHSPSTTGDGRAMALRAGAEIADADLSQRWAGPKYFARGGKGSWVGVVRDPQDKPVGPFVASPDRRYGDPVGNIQTSVFEDYCRTGRGPVYMDCRGISDADLSDMTYWLGHEGNLAVLNSMVEEGIDLRKTAVEFMTYEITTKAGALYNEKGETSLKGLFAAGDEYSGVVSGISGAAVFGWIAGESAARNAKETTGVGPDQAETKYSIEENKSLLAAIRGRQTGCTWQEANLALEQIMNDYAGAIRSESMLAAGQTHLARIKQKARDSLMALNQHELVHCLEVLNLLDIGELVFAASAERKETRGNFVRSDYPFTNPLLGNKYLVCRKIGNRTVTEWRQPKDDAK